MLCVCTYIHLGPSLGPHWHNDFVTQLFTLRNIIYLDVTGQGLSLKYEDLCKIGRNYVLYACHPFIL